MTLNSKNESDSTGPVRPGEPPEAAGTSTLIFLKGSRFKCLRGAEYHVPSWWTLGYQLAEVDDSPSAEVGRFRRESS
jgi:hypothetical protein